MLDFLLIHIYIFISIPFNNILFIFSFILSGSIIFNLFFFTFSPTFSIRSITPLDLIPSINDSFFSLSSFIFSSIFSEVISFFSSFISSSILSIISFFSFSFSFSLFSFSFFSFCFSLKYFKGAMIGTSSSKSFPSNFSLSSITLSFTSSIFFSFDNLKLTEFSNSLIL